jgi:hypothetical protein
MLVQSGAAERRTTRAQTRCGPGLWLVDLRKPRAVGVPVTIDSGYGARYG